MFTYEDAFKPGFRKMFLNLWDRYQIMMRQMLVTRRGNERFGQYGDREVSDFLDFETVIMTDATHVFSLYNLVALFKEFFGDSWPHWFGFPENWETVRDIIAYHDVAETKIGDWPKNGTNDRKLKDRLELAFMTDFFADFPNQNGSSLLRQFIRFQANPPTLPKLFDDFGFILDTCLAETYGVHLRVSTIKNPSREDLAVIEQLGLTPDGTVTELLLHKFLGSIGDHYARFIFVGLIDVIFEDTYGRPVCAAVKKLY